MRKEKKQFKNQGNKPEVEYVKIPFEFCEVE